MESGTCHQELTLTEITSEKAQGAWQIQLLTLALAAWTAWLVLYWISMIVCAPQNNDQSWYLYAAHLMLSGAHPYGLQIAETNPPLILWSSTIPVFLAHLLHLDSYLALKLLVFAMIAGSVAWSRRVLRASGLADLPPALRYLAVGSVLTAEIYLGWTELGQREHLLVILILPYIFSAVSNGRAKLSTAELCSLGLVAGVAVCFKPQQVLTLVALELSLAAWTRSLRRLISPDFLSAAFAILAYIAAVRLATPYFSKMVPILRETYWAYGEASVWTLIKTEPIFNILFVLALAVLVWQRRKLRFSAAIGAFLACAAAASIAYCSQHIGYLMNYRAYPEHAFLLLAIFWLTIDFFPPALAARWKFNSTFTGATLVFALILLPALALLSSASKRNKSFPTTVFAHYPPNTAVFTFSPNISDEFPAVLQDQLVWASRSPHLWMLPAIVQNEAAEAGGPAPGKVLPRSVVSRLAAEQRAETAEDFRRWQPKVVIIRRCHPGGNCLGMDKLNFDPLPWFLQSPQFAIEWSNYRLQTIHGDYDVYTRTSLRGASR